MPLEPCAALESALRIADHSFRFSGSPYWLSFGGLWGIVRNEGTIPDHDLDFCTYYGQDYRKIQAAFKSRGYEMTKVLVSDTDKDKAVYASLSSTKGLPHICLSFWYLHDGVRYYCHDQKHEVEGVGVPKSGYWFRGVPANLVEENRIRYVEWPGVNQQYKVRVPRFAGAVLDHLYIDWAYQKQRHEIGQDRQVLRDRCKSYHKGGATSPYEVHVASMGQWSDQKHIEAELEKSKAAWEVKLKNALQ